MLCCVYWINIWKISFQRKKTWWWKTKFFFWLKYQKLSFKFFSSMKKSVFKTKQKNPLYRWHSILWYMRVCVCVFQSSSYVVYMSGESIKKYYRIPDKSIFLRKKTIRISNSKPQQWFWIQTCTEYNSEIETRIFFLFLSFILFSYLLFFNVFFPTLKWFAFFLIWIF